MSKRELQTLITIENSCKHSHYDTPWSLASQDADRNEHSIAADRGVCTCTASMTVVGVKDALGKEVLGRMQLGNRAAPH